MVSLIGNYGLTLVLWVHFRGRTTALSARSALDRFAFEARGDTALCIGSN
jgi:hypothetical protein